MPNNFLTKEGYQKLQDELDYLRTAKRQEVANRLHEAMEGGELIENAEYEAAKNEQAFVEGRIQELEMLLATAKIIDENGRKKSDSVQIGSKVTIKEGSFDSETFTIVGVAEANPRDGKISNESPIGKAILNHRVGDTVKVETPGGTYNVKILKIVSHRSASFHPAPVPVRGVFYLPFSQRRRGSREHDGIQLT